MDDIAPQEELEYTEDGFVDPDSSPMRIDRGTGLLEWLLRRSE